MAVAALGSLALAAGMLASPPAPQIDATAPAATVTPQYQPPPPRYPGKKLSAGNRKRARGFVIGGGVLFGLAYLGGTLTGAVMFDERIEDGVLQIHERPIMRAAKLTLVPGAGPMVAAGTCKCGGLTAALAGMGIMQAMGMTYLALGAVPLLRHRRWVRWQLSAAPARGGGTLALHGRF